MASTVCKFSKIFRGSMPQDAPRVFFIFYMLQNDSQVKLRLKICRNLVPLSEKVSEYAADIKTILKGLIYAFFGSNVLVFS